MMQGGVQYLVDTDYRALGQAASAVVPPVALQAPVQSLYP
jgi:hypothetical protein